MIVAGLQESTRYNFYTAKRHFIMHRKEWLSTANFPSYLFIKDVFGDYTKPKQNKYASICLLLAAALEG